MRAPPAALWLLAAVLLGTGAAALVAQRALADARAAFDTDSRIAHRLLSQRAAEHEAVLATLALLQPPGGDAREARLAALYPQVLAVARRETAAAWPRDGWQAAEERSRTLRRPVLAEAQIAQGRYWLLHAGVPASYAVQIDLRRLPPAAEWPLPAGGATAAVLLHEGRRFVLQAATESSSERGWRFDARKPLAADSQPFELVTTRVVGWSALPWARMALAAAVVMAMLAALAAALRQRAARRRAEELLRLGQLGRLNQLGELAAGIAHELNQPLTALLAQTQAARRLLDDEPPQTTTARAAMDAAAAQARRASDVVGRLRRLVERPDGGSPQPLRLDDALRQAVDLLEPQIRRVGAEIGVQADAVSVRADPVALEQIVHNLLVNALQALERGAAGARRLRLSVRADGAQGLLRVADNGPGIAPELLPRIFEPFVTTREGGLGLGLSLCETLASGLGGSLTGRNAEGERGAVFELRLPLAAATPS